MNQKQIGLLVIIIGLLMGIFVYAAKAREDAYINNIINAQEGSCYLDDGTCLHQDRTFVPYIIGYVLAAALVILGIYLVFFDKTQAMITEQNKEVASALQEAKKDEKFEAFLSGFTPDEQGVLKAIKDQDGIKQSTLRFRTGLSKSMLSLILKSLESRNHISRKESGKTKQVFLRKKF